MKRVLLLMFLFLGFFSCSQKQELKEGLSSRKQVLSTIGMIEDLVREIGGEKIESHKLILGEIDPHSYEMVKGDDEKLGEADLIFYNGLGLEHGASLSFYLKNSSRAHSLGDLVKEKVPEKILYKEGVVDPHIWMDLSLWAELPPLIAERLSKIDPENEKFYQERALLLQKKIWEKHKEIFSLLQKIPEERRYLVTSHDAFHYFAKAYLSSQEKEPLRVEAPEGLAPDGAISSLDIKRIVSFVEEKKVQAIFAETNVSRASLEKIVEDSKKRGVQVEIAKKPLYGDCMPENQGYLSMQTHNAAVIFEFLCPKE